MPKNHIKAILKDFHRTSGDIKKCADRLIEYMPGIDKDCLEGILSEFLQSVFNADTLDAYADKILVGQPEVKEEAKEEKEEKKTKHSRYKNTD